MGDGWVTRADAARELGVNRATITRWVQKHPALLGEENLVNVAQLRQHRDQVVNPKLQTRGAASAGPSLNDARSRSESAKAGSAELDLADRLRLTLRRDDVEAAVAAAGDALRAAAFQMAREKAEALAMISDVREMERALDDMMRELLLTASQQLTLAGALPGSSHAA